MVLTHSPIIISRRSRQIKANWRDASSWLGGAPELGNINWPRDADNKPQPFFAQLSCPEIKSAGGPSEIPEQGALAFFKESVIYVADPQIAGSSKLPMDLPCVKDAGASLDFHGDTEGRNLFPRWPVRFMGFDFPDHAKDADARYEVQQALVNAHFGRRQFNLSVAKVMSEPRPLWWHTAITLAKIIDRVAHEDRNTDAENLKHFAKETCEWVQDKDPWTVMPRIEADCLHDVHKRATSEFRKQTRFRLSVRLEDYENATLILIASGNDNAYATLPETTRKDINSNYLLPIRTQHQLFGEPIDIQGNARWENERNHLLLQLTFDDLMFWDFGDCGVYQFWISPEDLAAGNWSSVNITFECH